jgi:DNA-binding PadR family transcriptional regulator
VSPGAPSRLSNTSAAVLGMVALGTSSGYDIRRAAERSVRFFWALGPPQIYAELKRLEADGLITGRDDARGERSRRVFDATPAGRAALQAWLTADEVGALEIRDPELLRLFFADVVDREDAVARVRLMRRRSEDALDHFRREITPAAARSSEAGSEFPEHVAAFGRELHAFVVDWCERLETTLSRRAPEAEPPA